MTHLILLNGPPRVGKDYAGLQIADAILVKFAACLKEGTHALYGLADEDGPYHDSYFEAVKDEPQPALLGLTPREAYIAVSETYMKPTHGIDVYGQMLLQYLERNVLGQYAHERPIVVTDSGFREEAVPLVERFGASSCLLIRVHAPQRDFRGDSRSYIDLSDLGVQCVDVQNHFDEAFGQHVRRVAETFLGAGR